MSAGTVQKALEALWQGGRELVGAASLCEMTGRGSFRAWRLIWGQKKEERNRTLDAKRVGFAIAAPSRAIGVNLACPP
ncbi:helix-turn-helix domain-containing protein [Mesorhizobium sp.]|uniref:helix-turn-helix domain-containing protein n=1 Tax=Mesorhizobium sp. TaxID=1871066 RepID=UPI000FEA19A2|nr:MAG: hypothetical protein EOS62_31175 [Mesorhizobium sp.]